MNTKTGQLSGKLYPIDVVTITYLLITAIYIAAFSHRLNVDFSHYLFRAGILTLIFVLYFFHKHFAENKLIALFRLVYNLPLLSYYYKETEFLNSLVFNFHDRFFAGIDQAIFGMQPSMAFAASFPGPGMNELMHFGYFSYFILIFLIPVLIYTKDKQLGMKAVFIVVLSFFIYYVIFTLLPVAGPQFYYHAVPANEKGYLFTWLLNTAQGIGEGPTGAFPSSHIGIAVVLLWMSCWHSKKLFYSTLPIVIILAFSTIYLKAHYVIDVVAGFLIAPFLTWFVLKIYQKLNLALE